MPGMGVKRESTSPQGARVPGMVISQSQPNLGLGGVPASCRLGRFTNMAVPRFDRTVCWKQHQQVFNNAIAKSNGWDDETAALQLFAHLEGEALNVALLVIWVFPGLCIGCWTGYIGPVSVRMFDHIWLAVRSLCPINLCALGGLR